MESSNTNIQDAVTRFKDYNEYLDSKMTSMDLVFLTSKEVARKLVEHGHKGTVLSRREFEQQKAASASATRYHRNQTTTLASSGCDIRDNFLRELAEREEANRTGKMTAVAALHPRRERRGSGSVWLFGLRPQTADAGLCAILQRQEEASARTPGFMFAHSYYNWTKQTSASTGSANYDVIYEQPDTLLFRRKTDGSILNVDPRVHPGQDAQRSAVQSDLYEHVAILDHYIASA
ncbi:cilia- and flagella-associated protein 299 isoform X2 [Syngnathus acus]|uniref:cilia- and flagella-associated protein 299 isoform X2 n=1 Tax=Syngnathus acus TaxID=161584 RepID=UPI001885C029|nr:cilia- and flagella-associated protein 299 isoform X2 [Syngnathus acus]